MPRALKENDLVKKLITEKDNYFQLASRPFTIQRFEIIGFFAWKFLKSKVLAMPLVSGSDGCWLEQKASLASYRRQGLAMLRPGVWSKQKKHYLLASKRLAAISKQASFCRNNRQSLSLFFEKWQTALDDFSYYFIAPFWVEDFIFPKLQKLIKDEKELEIISSPDRVFFYQRFQKELLAMGRHIYYSYLINKYAFLTEYSLKERLLDRMEIKRRCQEIAKQNLSENIIQAAKKARENKRLFAALYRRLPAKTAVMADIVHDYVSIRTERIESYQQALVRVRYFYKLLAKLIARVHPGFSYLDAVSLTNSELRYFLSGNNDLPFAEIRKRSQRQFALLYERGREESIFIYQARSLQKLSQVFLTASRPADGLIRGIIVSKGRARGRVRIIYRPDQFKNFKAGEILVSNYTSPAFMPLIKRARAIITDEGGVTSHAAIVSRELGVPCVTGAKIATKVLHNGDLVEVDADKGTIKIIKAK
jgi:phosphoenolpyruvate synthase/pyruvate phosphate dikinase